MNDVTVISADAVQQFGSVVIASDHKVVGAMHDDGVDQFALNHILETPGRINLFFNERDGDKMVTRTFEFDPIKLHHAIQRLVVASKAKNEDAFI